MQRLAATAFTSLALGILVAGCGLDSHVAPEGARSIEQTAGPMLVDQSMPEWHPALPDGHPPVYQGATGPAGGPSPVAARRPSADSAWRMSGRWHGGFRCLAGYN